MDIENPCDRKQNHDKDQRILAKLNNTFFEITLTHHRLNLTSSTKANVEHLSWTHTSC